MCSQRRRLFMKKWIPSILLVVIALFWAMVLKNDFMYVLVWWAVMLIIGLMFYPLSMSLFSSFTDRGYLFSKAIGIAISAYMVWLLSFVKVAKLTQTNCWVVVAFCGIIVFILFYKNIISMKTDFHKDDTLFWIPIGEGLFLFSLSFWTYLRASIQRLKASKILDYGFVNSILRSGYVPRRICGLPGNPFNYSISAISIGFFTRLSGIKTEIAYNLMMATLFAFSMALCFIIVTNLLKGFGLKKNTPVMIGGFLASILVSLGGNLHSFFYGLLPKLAGKEDSYWFPDATRYIGYNPDTNDKTIHEFPVYSFVVSDLHAHVINMIFVLTILGVLLAVFRKLQKRKDEGWQPQHPLQELFFPEMLLLGLFIVSFKCPTIGISQSI